MIKGCTTSLKRIQKRALRKIDVFGYDARMLVFGERKFTTSLGGVLTVFYYIFIISMFFFLGSNMINKQNPEVTISQVYKQNPIGSKVGPDDYFFIFGMQHPTNSSHFYDPSIYTVNVKNFRSKISFERCTEEHLPREPDLRDFFLKAHGSSLRELLCLAKNTSVEIAGDFIHIEDFKSIEISISPCVNDSQAESPATVCKSKEEIKIALKNSFFAYYSTDTLIDILQKEAGKTVGLDYYIETDTTVRKRIVRFLSTSVVSEDSGWIIRDERERSYTVMDRDREILSIIESEEQGSAEILNMVIRKSVYEKYYTRKYMKIQSVLALMGGFLHVLHSFFALISRPFGKKFFYDSIINSIYNFEHPQDPGDKNYSPEQQPLHVSVMELALKAFSSNPKLLKKTKQRDKAIEKIRKKLDLAYILEIFHDLEKFKMLLLNEDQYRLFEYLPKPRIQADLTINYSPASLKYASAHRLERNFFFTEDFEKEQRDRNAEDALKKIIAKRDLGDVDLKLISLMSSDMKTLFFSQEDS